MIPIPVFWNEYTATTQGSALKFVPCENCPTEYVYVMEREGLGSGTSMYALNNEGAAAHASSAAEETLTAYLENDFDPVPCPACGHYQRYMFPKLLEAKGMWVDTVMFLVLGLSCLAAVIALYSSMTYLQRPNDHALDKMVTAWSALLVLCLIGLGLAIIKRYKIRQFDPNREDEEGRIAKGRSRAITRAEFEKVRQEKANLNLTPAPPTNDSRFREHIL